MAIDKDRCLAGKKIVTQLHNNNVGVGVDHAFALSNAATRALGKNCSPDQEGTDVVSLLSGITRFRTLQLQTATLFPSYMLRKRDSRDFSQVNA
jgi:hypothetical protein